MDSGHNVHAHTGSHSRLRTNMVRLLIGAVAAFIGLIALSSPASAQAACTINTIVSDATELDAAIGCYNAQTPAGDHGITFSQDIVHTTGTPTIDSTVAATKLVINGAGYALTGPRGADGTGPNIAGFVDLITVDNPDAAAEITNITVNGADNHAIRVNGGSVTITDTTSHHNTIAGINVVDGVVTIANTTTHNNTFGISVTGGTATVTNTTIHDNSFVGDFVSSGDVTMLSSIVSATGIGAACGGAVDVMDGGNNFVSGTGCPAGFTALTGDALGAAGLNGCTEPCTETIALPANSNAIGGGKCTGLTDAAGEPITLEFDQRGTGFARTSGADCDAGSYELNVCAATAGEAATDIADASELDDAIACYNTQQPAGDHTLTLTADITHTSGIPTIDSATDTGNLTVDGAGFTLTGPRGADGNGPDIAGDVDLITIDNTAVETAIRNITINGADNDAIIVNSGAVGIANVTTHNNDNGGIGVVGGSVTIANTTTHTNDFFGIFVSGGSAVISNSTTHANVAGIFVNGGTATVANTTSHDNNTGIFVAGGTVTIVSSIVSAPTTGGTACSGTIVDGSNNLVSGTGCPAGFVNLTTGSLATALADNGCTAAGCTQTIALLAGSNAVGAGRCTNVPVGLDAADTVLLGVLNFDQRGTGFLRTINVGCDAGAFEVNCTNPFTDVASDQFFTNPVIWAACNGVTTGTAVGPPALFSPTGDVTRGQMATFLWRYAGRPTPTGAPHEFTDVPDGAFYSVPIQWLSEEGITTGTGDGTTFSPNDIVTRAQMATFLWRLEGEPTAPDHPFTDVFGGVFYETAVAWLSDIGVTEGTGDGTTYSPDVTLTRAQAVTFLWRLRTLPVV